MTTLEKLPYASLDFRGYIESIIPPRKARGDIGEFFIFKYLNFHDFFFISIIYIYILFNSKNSFI